MSSYLELEESERKVCLLGGKGVGCVNSQAQVVKQNSGNEEWIV